ncbi:MAG: phytanoyl-CoA dioxygenase family protein [candidate division Zixibacteria bacterium]|nr:phytanoyl-CoA dioxygenase family protein [candidate division Zixibacteria bacterium]
MDIHTVLYELGVRDDTLTPAENRSLDQDGYVVLENMFTLDQTAAFIRRLEQLAEEEGDRAGVEAHQEEGTIRLADLINKDPMFEYCFTHPRLLACALHTFPDGFKVDSLNARFALPGMGGQMLHADWGPSQPSDWDNVKAKRYYGMNSMWILNDFTAENGATRIVPGTHRVFHLPQDVMHDRFAPYPGEVILEGPAGTVVAFNSHCWQGGTLNRTSDLRRVMHMAYRPRETTSLTDQGKHLRAETAQRLTPAMRYVLGV